MKMKKIVAPLNEETILTLKAGDQVSITGTIYTARDAAHARMIENLEKGIPIPFDVENQIIYYVGPCPAKPGEVIGSAGPTTSHRMDAYAPELIKRGLGGMLGKGNRGQQVIDAMKKYHCVYFSCVGGAGALLQDCIKEVELIDYKDLGTEAIRKLKVIDFPAIVSIDCQGNNLYEVEKLKYVNKNSGGQNG